MIKTFVRYQSIILGILFLTSLPLSGQNNPVEAYLKEAGDHAVIYNGELETLYSSQLYENTPYYVSSDFAPGQIHYEKNIYSGQMIRLDLYKDRLILLTPHSNYPVILPNDKVSKVQLHNKVFVRQVPSGKNDLKEGYYMLLHDGDKLKLLGRERFMLNQPTNKVTSNFDLSRRYYLLYNGEYHQMRNKRSFSKLFPEYKKQINKLVRDQALDFGDDLERSLTVLSKYCEEWKAKDLIK